MTFPSNLPAHLPKAVLFDWDNTLVNSWKPLQKALNITFKGFNRPAWTLEEVKARVHLSLRDYFPKIFGEDWKEAEKIFYEAYQATHLQKLAPLPGSEALLQLLAEKNIYLGIVSNKNGAYLRREVDILGWSRFFGAVIGSRDTDCDKPSVIPVEAALQPSGILRSKEVWFVGDTKVDLECALNAGCFPVMVVKENFPHQAGISFDGCLQLLTLFQIWHEA